MPREPAGGTGATAFRLSPSGIVQPLPDLPPTFYDPYPETYSATDIAAWNDFLELTRRLAPFTVFYNGPRSGASAPDHAHFQAVTRGIMPLDEEVSQFIRQSYASVYDNRIYPLTGNLRPGLVIQAATEEAATRLFKKIYAALPILPGEPEPMMNIFGSYYDNNWVITVIPRKRHRPWQYEAEGNDHLLSSPGAADIGGLFITPLEKDFKKINPELLRDVYQQVCLNDRDVEEIFVHLSSN